MRQPPAYTPHARWLRVLGLALVVAATPTAFAQDGETGQGAPEESASSAPPEGVEVIRIKGRSPAAIDTEVPSSVTQFDSDTIEALGAQNVSDLAKVTPNVEIRTSGATAPTFFIRGVGLSDFNANASGAVAVYQDGVAFNAPALQLGQLFDVENVEVLRGPQGGGPVRNGSAGAIKISSRKPVGDVSASLTSKFGNYGYKDFDGALEFPLVEDVLSGRLSFRFAERDGWGKNGCAGLPPLEERIANAPEYHQVSFCGEDYQQGRIDVPNPDPPPRNYQLSNVPGGLPYAVNDLGNWAARGVFRFQPEGTEMDWLAIAHGGRRDQFSTLGQVVGTKGRQGYGTGFTNANYVDPDIEDMRDAGIAECTGQPDCNQSVDEALGPVIAKNLDIRPSRGDYDRVGQTRLDTWGGSLQGNLPVGPVRLRTTSAYDGYDRYRDEDSDFSPAIVFESVTQDDAWQFFQDLGVEGELEDYPLRWSAGGYYLMEKLSSVAVFEQAEGRRQDQQSYTQDLWSFAFYGGFVWDFLDDFTLEGGVRYNWERKAFDFGLETNLGRPNQVSDGFQDERTWKAPTGTLSLTYRFREDLSAYWKYSRGWKGGQFNASALSLREIEPAEPETIDAWETGLSGYWADGRLGITAALFYYKYYDYQVFIVENNLGAFPQIQVINANEAQVYGAELEARIEPLAGLVPSSFDGLRLTARFGWLETEFLDFTNEAVRTQLVTLAPPVTRIIPFTIDYSGNPLINAPRFKLSINAEWTFDLGRFGSITPRYDGAWSSKVFFDPAKGRGAPNIEGDIVLPEYAIGQPALFLHNLALQYTLPIQNVQITGWVRNLTDERYKTYAFDASQFANSTLNFIGEPRMFGGTVAIFW